MLPTGFAGTPAHTARGWGCSGRAGGWDTPRAQDRQPQLSRFDLETLENPVLPCAGAVCRTQTLW